MENNGKYLQVVNYSSKYMTDLNKFLKKIGDNVFSVTPIYNKRHEYLEYVIVYYM